MRHVQTYGSINRHKSNQNGSIRTAQQFPYSSDVNMIYKENEVNTIRCITTTSNDNNTAMHNNITNSSSLLQNKNITKYDELLW
jgi:hypothetical protein